MGSRVHITMLGQEGVRLQLGRFVIYIDPYLSDSVEKLEGDEFRRLRAAPISPGGISDADIVLITHEHLDHCDPETLVPMSLASPACKFYGSNEVIEILGKAGIPTDLLKPAGLGEFMTAKGLQMHAVPAAHPGIEMRDHSNSRFLGFVIVFHGLKIYHAGDTSVHPDIVRELKNFVEIDLAFVPVNEKNYYRDDRGIIGNMSVRDAFQFATEIGVKKFVPVHWDMFAPNQVYREEIELLYKKLKPPFAMTFDPGTLEVISGR